MKKTLLPLIVILTVFLFGCDISEYIPKETEADTAAASDTAGDAAEDTVETEAAAAAADAADAVRYVPTDLSPILSGAPIEKICCNGTKSFELYQKYQLPRTGIPAEKLPSTSPANAVWSLKKLTEAWGEVLIN